MVGKRKKPKKDDAQSQPAARQAGYRDWDNIVPGEPMAPQPYAEQSWQSAPAYPTQQQPQAPAPAAPPQPQPQYQQPAPQPQQQPQYQQAPPQPQYQQPAQAAPAAAPPAAAGAAAGLNPADGTCTKCGAGFGQKAVCEGCGAGRTACLVCGTKIWAGALTCSAHSNAMRR